MPAAPLRLVEFNVHWDVEGAEAVAAAVRPLRPDLLFLEEVPEKDLLALALSLGMTHRGVPQVFYSPRPPEGTSGTAVLARHPLSHGRLILPSHDQSDHADWGHGAWAEVTVEDRRFAVAVVHLTPTQAFTPWNVVAAERRRGQEIADLIAFWKSQGSPPLLLGGDFNQLPVGSNYESLSENFEDALSSLNRAAPTCATSVPCERASITCGSRASGSPWQATCPMPARPITGPSG